MRNIKLVVWEMNDTLYFRENSSLSTWELIHLGGETSWGKMVLTEKTGNYRLLNIHANV